MDAATLTDDLRHLRTLKETKDDLKKRADEAERDFKQWQQHCLTRMESEDAQSHRTDGTTFSPVEKIYASVQDRSAFVAWAKANDDELIEDKERGVLLSALVRERLDNGEELPPGVGFYTREYISMRAATS